MFLFFSEQNAHTDFRIFTLNRNEEGVYYAIDLGGTNFRALRVEVGAGSVVTSRKVELPIPEELTKGTIEVLVISFIFHFLTKYVYSMCL
jgi:hexokinase